MMKKIDLSKLNLIYLCVIVVYMAIREVLPLNFLISHVAVSAALFLAGGILVVLDLAHDRNCLRGLRADLLILFLIVCVVSSLINIRYGIFDNIKLIAALAVEFLVFFAYSKGKSGEEMSHSVTVITSVLMIVWAFLTVVSMLMYFFSVDILVFGRGSWDVVNQGFSSEYVRLWGIFQDPNYASMICLVSTLSAVRLLVLKKNWVLRCLCALNIVLMTLYVIMSGSRAGYLLSCLALVLLTLWWLLFSKGISIKRLLLGGVSAVAAVVAFSLLVNGIRIGMPMLKKAAFPEITPAAVNRVYHGLYDISGLDYAPYGTDLPDFGDDEPETLDRTDLAEKDDVSNGRFERWQHAFSIFLKTPVFGASPRNVSAFAEVHNPDTLMAQYGIASHNGYIDVLVETGIVGFIVLAAVVLMGAVLALMKYFRKGSHFDVAYYTTVVLVLGASAVFISDVYMIFSMNAFIFWLMLGAIGNYDSAPEERGVAFSLFNKLFRKGA